MTEKLKLNKEFRRTYGRGKSVVNHALVCYILHCGGDNIRYGITVSKKLGKAVKRNRAKRLITAAFRAVSANVKPGTQVVFVARSAIFNQKSQQIAQTMRSSFISAGAWEEYDR